MLGKLSVIVLLVASSAQAAVTPAKIRKQLRYVVSKEPTNNPRVAAYRAALASVLPQLKPGERVKMTMLRDLRMEMFGDPEVENPITGTGQHDIRVTILPDYRSGKPSALLQNLTGLLSRRKNQDVFVATRKRTTASGSPDYATQIELRRGASGLQRVARYVKSSQGLETVSDVVASQTIRKVAIPALVAIAALIKTFHPDVPSAVEAAVTLGSVWGLVKMGIGGRQDARDHADEASLVKLRQLGAEIRKEEAAGHHPAIPSMELAYKEYRTQLEKLKPGTAPITFEDFRTTIMTDPVLNGVGQ
jgi:hypothetical protein